MPGLVRAGWLYPILILMVLGGAIAIRIADPVALQALRSVAFDTYQRLDPVVYSADSPVRIVAIDQDSLDRIGPWPWPAKILASLLTDLSRQGAVVVAFDILFPASGADAGNKPFTAAITAARTVLPVVLTNQPADDPLPPAKAAFAVVGDDPRPFIPAFANAFANRPDFDAAAAGIGVIDRAPEADVFVSRIPLVARVGKEVLPAFAVEVLRVAQAADAYVISASVTDAWTALGRQAGVSQVKVGDIEMPTDPDGGMRLNLRPSNPAAHIPAWQVLTGENDAGKVAGRIVLVGLTAPGLADRRSTPLEPSIAHVELEAEAIEHILSGRTLTRPAEARALEIAVVLVVGLLLAGLIPRLRLFSAALVSVLMVSLLLVGGWFAFRDFAVVLDPTWPALSISVLAVSAMVYFRRRLESRRAQIRRAFGHSIAPAIVDAVLAFPGKVVLTGERRELTVMFCRMKNLASFAEHMEAPALVEFVNSFYAPLSQAILARGGTVARNMGDTIMAFWNAPLEDDMHAANALLAATAVVVGTRQFEARMRVGAAAAGRKFDQVAVGIGISTGSCAVGTLGDAEHSDYSAIGEAVDVAARLGGSTDIYGVAVVVDGTTVQRIAEARFIELDLIRGQGRGRPIAVYAPLDLIDGDRETLDRLASVHAGMIAYYRSCDWDAAEAARRECLAFGVESLATLYGFYEARIAAFAERAPPSDWDGAEAAMLK